MYIEEVSKIATQLGGFILCFGLVSYFVKERLRVSEALISTLVGIILGPKVLKTLDPTLWGSTDELIHGFTRIVMFSGVTLPNLSSKRKEIFSSSLNTRNELHVAHKRIMIFTIVLSKAESLVLASCVTSTDPILANSVVKGKFAEKHVPPHIRNLLSAESGVTDGMAEQFLYLSIYLMDLPFGQAIGQWILIPILYKIGLSIVIGIFTGYIARKLLYLSEKNRLIDKESFLVFAIALALFLTGFVSIVGGSDLLACFIAGTSFTWDDWFRRETEEAHLQEVIDMLLNLAVFALIGSLIPWKSFVDVIVWWRLLILSIIILVFRRMPAVFVLSKMNLIPAVKTYREGPIGVGAIYCSTLAKLELDSGDSHKALIVFFLVFSSIMVHGITIPLVMISKRINTRTFTAGSVYNQVSRLPVIRIGQDVFFTTDDKGNILPS
ncbi:12486_t:CDS:10, partial [Acaulospora morrowiae]